MSVPSSTTSIPASGPVRPCVVDSTSCSLLPRAARARRVRDYLQKP